MVVDIACAGAVVHDADGRLLLVLRGRPPAAGTWSLPGGRLEPGEDAAAAAVREVAEETGLNVVARHPVGVIRRSAPDGGTYVIEDLACEVVGGRMSAGDDADDARWFDSHGLALVSTSPGLVDALTQWGAMPRT